MNGQLVFKNAVVRFSEVIMEGLNHNDLKPDQIDMLIPHQANLRISQFVQKSLVYQMIKFIIIFKNMVTPLLDQFLSH
ncbi:MAG: hypothetical protein CM15mP126_7880 [Gammaproteobacteria bacterium]|nr:MAG: hypothetical protein CM15mP126_7880 [Gammaproteobacteria bacterium]